MNLELSQEQEFLRDAARDALGRVKTVEAAREALEDPNARPDLWPTACEAGWAGLIVSEQHGGAELGAFDAMLVMIEAGRVLAGIELLGHLPASALLNAGGYDDLGAIAEGTKRAAWLPTRPPTDDEPSWTVEARGGSRRVPAVTLHGDRLSGTVAWVPDAPGADVLVVIGVDAGGEVAALAVDAAQDGVSVQAVTRYDATRSLGHVTLDGATGQRLSLDADGIAHAWYFAQTLLAAEGIGTVETCLATSVQYAKERFTFGRAIGSYQAVKHALVEVLRRRENAYSLLVYAGWSHEDRRDEFPLAASAARAAASAALDYAARELISVHGGIGATWEHDAPLFFRRAQLSRRLLGGMGDATDRVAGELLAKAGAAG
jgi:alkylation response protein AidB-like acyl-CoA dehydrogenase